MPHTVAALPLRCWSCLYTVQRLCYAELLGLTACACLFLIAQLMLLNWCPAGVSADLTMSFPRSRSLYHQHVDMALLRPVAMAVLSPLHRVVAVGSVRNVGAITGNGGIPWSVPDQSSPLYPLHGLLCRPRWGPLGGFSTSRPLAASRLPVFLLCWSRLWAALFYSNLWIFLSLDWILVARDTFV